MEHEMRRIDLEREKRKAIDILFEGQRRDIQFNEDGSLSHLNYEFKDQRGAEFCVQYDYAEPALSPRSSKAWKLNHVNKWVDPVLGEAEFHPWVVDASKAEEEITKKGIRLADMLRYVLVLERSNLSKKELPDLFERTKPKWYRKI